MLEIAGICLSKTSLDSCNFHSQYENCVSEIYPHRKNEKFYENFHSVLLISFQI